MEDRRDPFTRQLEAQGQRELEQARAALRRRKRDIKTRPSCFNCVFRFSCTVSALHTMPQMAQSGIVPPMACGGVGYGYKPDPKLVPKQEEEELDPMFGADLDFEVEDFDAGA